MQRAVVGMIAKLRFGNEPALPSWKSRHDFHCLHQRRVEKALRQQGIRPEVLLEFIRKTIGWLASGRKLSVPTLLHVRFALEKALREKIEACRQKAYNFGYQLRL